MSRRRHHSQPRVQVAVLARAQEQFWANQFWENAMAWSVLAAGLVSVLALARM